jgi:hypothetical protein
MAKRPVADQDACIFCGFWVGICPEVFSLKNEIPPGAQGRRKSLAVPQEKGYLGTACRFSGLPSPPRKEGERESDTVEARMSARENTRVHRRSGGRIRFNSFVPPSNSGSPSV